MVYFERDYFQMTLVKGQSQPEVKSQGMSQWTIYPDFSLFPPFNLPVNPLDRSRSQRTQEPLNTVHFSHPAREEKGVKWVWSGKRR